MTIYKRKLTKVPVKTVCDLTKKEAFSKLVLCSYYGSKHDGAILSIDLSDEMVDEIRSFLENRFGEKKIKSLTDYAV